MNFLLFIDIFYQYFILMQFWSKFLVLISVSLQVPRAYFGARKQIQQFPLLSVGYQDNLIGTVIEEKIEKIPSLDVSHKHGTLVYSDVQRDVIARVNISEDSGFSQYVIKSFFFSLFNTMLILMYSKNCRIINWNNIYYNWCTNLTI